MVVLFPPCCTSSSVGYSAIQLVKAVGGMALATTITSAKKQKLLNAIIRFAIATQEKDLVLMVMEITQKTLRSSALTFAPLCVLKNKL